MTDRITVKVSKRNQIAVPSAAREHLGISGGDYLLVDIQDGMLILIPQPADYTKNLRGLHKEIWEGTDIKYIKKERDEWED